MRSRSIQYRQLFFRRFYERDVRTFVPILIKNCQQVRYIFDIDTYCNARTPFLKPSSQLFGVATTDTVLYNCDRTNVLWWSGRSFLLLRCDQPLAHTHTHTIYIYIYHGVLFCSDDIRLCLDYSTYSYDN